ncbi:MAG: DUF1501 domain-containing protein [Granulosicoccaceae bacterium]
MSLSERAEARCADAYKALVCVFLAGGNDSFNMLAPLSSNEYRDYASARAHLALPSSGPGALLPVSPINADGRSFGIHPGMPELQGLFDSGAVDFFSNVGTLVEPTTPQQFKRGATAVPEQLLAHADQTMQWQTSMPQMGVSSGWAGRLADLYPSGSGPGRLPSMLISLSGQPVFMLGKHAKARPLMTSIDSATQDEAGISCRSDFPSTALGSQLETIARTIEHGRRLGLRRQVFFVQMAGWDHHHGLLHRQSQMLPVLSQGLGAFWAALGKLGLQDNVTTFTASEFGRSLHSRASGSEHGWGGNQIVMGGASVGKSLHGVYPETLRLGSGQDISGAGSLLPTTSTDQYFAQLLRWYGVSDSDLQVVLPNLSNFS